MTGVKITELIQVASLGGTEKIEVVQSGASYSASISQITNYLTNNAYISSLNGEASSSGLPIATVTLNNSSVIGKVLTGYTSGAGTVSATDSILQAIQKLNGNDALKAAISGQTFTGDVGIISNSPTFYYTSNSAAVDNKKWFTAVDSIGSFIIYATNDAQNLSNQVLNVTRTGYSITSVNFYNAGSYFFRNAAGVALATIDTSGFLNIGGTASYPLYVQKAAVFSNVMCNLNNTGGTKSRISFQDTTTTFNPDIGSDGNNFIVNIAGSQLLKADPSGIESITLKNTAQTGNIKWYGDIDNAKWITSLGGYFLKFGNPNAAAGYETITADSIGFKTVVRFHSTGLDTYGQTNLATNAGGVVVGGLSINANAILDVQSTTKAFMPPRMTTTQKNAIASPTSGMVVYDSTLNKLCVRGASAWETITSV